jgi:hypothetical protein
LCLNDAHLLGVEFASSAGGSRLKPGSWLAIALNEMLLGEIKLTFWGCGRHDGRVETEVYVWADGDGCEVWCGKDKKEFMSGGCLVEKEVWVCAGESCSKTRLILFWFWLLRNDSIFCKPLHNGEKEQRIDSNKGNFTSTK